MQRPTTAEMLAHALALGVGSWYAWAVWDFPGSGRSLSAVCAGLMLAVALLATVRGLAGRSLDELPGRLSVQGYLVFVGLLTLGAVTAIDWSGDAPWDLAADFGAAVASSLWFVLLLAAVLLLPRLARPPHQAVAIVSGDRTAEPSASPADSSGPSGPIAGVQRAIRRNVRYRILVAAAALASVQWVADEWAYVGDFDAALWVLGGLAIALLVLAAASLISQRAPQELSIRAALFLLAALSTVLALEHALADDPGDWWSDTDDRLRECIAFLPELAAVTVKLGIVLLLPRTVAASVQARRREGDPA